MVAKLDSLIVCAVCILSWSYEYQRQRGDPENFPGGSWMRSAADVSMRGNKLCARLQMANGLHASRTCVNVQVGQEFNNADGRFQIVQKEIPGGTWLVDTSRNAYRQGNLVCAELRREDMSWEHFCWVAEGNFFYENLDGKLSIRTPSCDTMPNCKIGFVKRPGGDQLYCKYSACSPRFDNDECCEPAEPCSNVTWCPKGFVSHPERFCPAVKCDSDRDEALCCVPIGSCAAMTECLKGYTPKLNAYDIYCPRPACDRTLDRDRCCDEAAPCWELGNQSGSHCPMGTYFNLDDFCDGTSCVDARDRTKCCAEATPCADNFTCPYGFLPKIDTPLKKHYCDGERWSIECDQSRDSPDIQRCCDAAMPCHMLQCPFGFYDEAGVYCLGVTCDDARDIPVCCRESQSCLDLLENLSFTAPIDPSVPPCQHGEFFNLTDYCDGSPCEPSRDVQLCCQDAQACNTTVCPYGYVMKLDPGNVFCNGLTCDITRDVVHCCDDAAPCTALVCPLGYVPVSNVASLFCDGVSCDLARDRDICCAPAMNCIGGYTCEHSYTPKLNESYCGGAIPGAYTCEAPRDRQFCCDDAEICSALPCDYGYVTIPDTYCLGTSCERLRDYFICCELGLKFEYYRFYPLMLRTRRADAMQMAEITFLFHGATVDLSTATAFSPPGSNAPVKEGPEKAIDGIVSTKWLDYTSAPLIVKPNPAEVIDAYTWYTANDEPRRDPIRWRFEASEDNRTWVLLHQEVNSTFGKGWVGVQAEAPNIPLQRFAQVGPFAIGVPCLALNNVQVRHAMTPSCVEGKILANGTSCTPQCEYGYDPSIDTLTCVMGNYTPPIFTCILNETLQSAIS